MSLLTCIQDALNELGLPAPTTIISNPDQSVVQMLAFANRIGTSLMSDHDWVSLQTAYTFQTVAVNIGTGTVTSGSAVVTGIADTTGVVVGMGLVTTGFPASTLVLSVDSGTQITCDQVATASGTPTIICGQIAYAMPSDFDRFINRTHWDKTKHWELRGPVSPQEWQWISSGIIATGPRRRYRVNGIGNKMDIFPTPTVSGDLLGFEYISNGWVQPASGAMKSKFTDDADVSIFRDALMTVGLKYRYFDMKGFATDSLKQEFDRQFQQAAGRDGGSPTLSLSRRRWPIFITPAAVPDTGFGNP